MTAQEDWEVIRKQSKELGMELKPLEELLPKKVGDVVIDRGKVTIDSDNEIISISLKYDGKKLPEHLFTLPKLERLELHINNMTKISAKIGQLQQLKSLTFVADALEELPKEIGNLSNLKTLVINSGSLQTLPEEITDLHDLDMGFLHLPYNLLSNLPESIRTWIDNTPEVSSRPIERTRFRGGS